MELALLHLPFATLIYDTRSVVIGYLHLAFLGFISLFIVALYQMEKVLDETSLLVTWGVSAFLVGFIVNEFVLFSSGLFEWLGGIKYWYQNELLLFASLFLVSGVLLMWSNLFARKDLSVVHDNKAFKKAT